MKKILREPLLHFLLLGAGLFVLNGLTSERTITDDPAELVSEGEQRQPVRNEPDRNITVTPGRVEQLVTVFQKKWQRLPTQSELKNLIDEFVLEEVYYRAALAMGLDRDDTIIRRRLRQKMEFLSDDIASLAEPTDEELIAYLAKHADKFRASPKYTFQQMYFNPEKHGPNPKDYVETQLEVLRADKPVQEDRLLLLPKTFEAQSTPQIDGQLGGGFSRQLDDLEVGKWDGPVRSGYGLHLVRIDKREQGRLPELDEIRPIVIREWTNDKQLEIRQQFNEKLLKKYDVTVEWPGSENAEKP